MGDDSGTLLDAARRVLQDRGEPMRTEEVWSEISARRLFVTTGTTPSATLATELLRASLGQRIASRRNDRPLYKAGSATFGLLEWLSPEKREELQRKEAALDASDDGEVPWEGAIEELTGALTHALGNAEYLKIVAGRDEVQKRFGPVFQREHLTALTADEVRQFLIFSNNRHWQGLQRLGPAVTRDMDTLRDALGTLFDEQRPLDERVDYAHARVPKLAQAIITPILLIHSPKSYGVWNRVSEEGLARIGLLPKTSRRATLGQRYTAINDVLVQISNELAIDLWALDALWWAGFGEPVAKPVELPSKPTDRVWIEITEEQHDHGGLGWELGKCLWSPTRNAAGSLTYELMREPKPGDVVIHFVAPLDGGQRRIAGKSVVASAFEQRDDQPPQPGKWAEMAPYYRIALKDYRPFPNAPSVDVLVQRGRDVLRSEAEATKHYPYSKYGESVRLSQGRYLARCTADLYELIIEVLGGAAVNAVTPEPDLAQISRDFAGALREAHLSFGPRHEEVARNFVCSLAAKRFVILTGLSGSGKTQLAAKFGQWLGGKERYELVPVRPDWTGPESLLGYEDALLPPSEDGRRAWCVPRTLELFLRAARDPSNPYLLILDEMNLAHVERYFADVLSGIESDEAIIPDLRDEDGIWRPAKRGLTLTFPENVFIVGTINVDETTYMFSPKVLDRANTIEFRVETSDLPSEASDARRPVQARSGSAALVAGFLEIAGDDEWQLDHAPDFIEEFVEQIRALHTILRASGDEFGHRTFFEGVRLAALLAQAGDVTLEAALDVFVLQKVLPRMHGARRRLEPVLRALARFCLRTDSDASDPFGTQAVHVRLPAAFAKTARMFHALKANQFASFSD